MWLRRIAQDITIGMDHVSDEGTPGSTVLCELTRDFLSILSPSCVAEVSRPGEGPTPSVVLQFACVMCETVWAEVGS